MVMKPRHPANKGFFNGKLFKRVNTMIFSIKSRLNHTTGRAMTKIAEALAMVVLLMENRASKNRKTNSVTGKRMSIVYVNCLYSTRPFAGKLFMREYTSLLVKDGFLSKISSPFKAFVTAVEDRGMSKKCVPTNTMAKITNAPNKTFFVTPDSFDALLELPDPFANSEPVINPSKKIVGI